MDKQYLTMCNCPADMALCNGILPCRHMAPLSKQQWQRTDQTSWDMAGKVDEEDLRIAVGFVSSSDKASDQALIHNPCRE